MKRLSTLFAIAFAATVVAAPSSATSVALEVESRVISHFGVGSSERAFGKLEFVGGITYSSPNSLLGAVSSIRFRPDGTHFVAGLDTGHWLTGAIQRDEEGALAGLSELHVTSMLNAEGQANGKKVQMDAEGLALAPGAAIVSYEQRHRVDVYPDPGFETSGPKRSYQIPFPRAELRSNRGFETLVVAPSDGPLAGAPVIVAERSLNKDGNLLAAVLDGPMKGTFSVVRNDPYDATDGAFLPNGDLLLLERRFRLSDGVGMRIRRIKAADIRPGAVADGEVLIDADMSHQIDNMEGLDVVQLPDGDIRIIVVSDDNHSILQRNLMLEFRLIGGTEHS
ncbi:esterase-like activity of phytase family protein [Rhizobium sp. ARZ01]|uniref:esterase-like activity of phytase family protein n=1 Tax=Rhizobium sp. ARZ01 TaxID=2769313 RepID=UPI00177C8DC4|nr:esterase-like activity of phytase family protein [Rhizobium sp. ARZ01]MBD9374903.1 esterase-like activity of phytase family protein [Rhizobium sp. ARZ01]